MKFIGYNAVSISMIILAGFLVHKGVDGWGWVVLGAALCTVYPATMKENEK